MAYYANVVGFAQNEIICNNDDEELKLYHFVFLRGEIHLLRLRLEWFESWVF